MKFEKVSFEQYKKDNQKRNKTEEEQKQEYDSIILPKRSTKGSAGYDFVLPYDVTYLSFNKLCEDFREDNKHKFKVYTGIRADIDDGYVLMLFPRSGLGMKYGMTLTNTVGVIDSDYYHAENEGHIAVGFTFDETVSINKGDRFVQGVFMKYGLVDGDECETKRTGGMGSTGK